MKTKYSMGAVEAWKYLNLDAKHPAQWDLFPATFAELSAAMDAIPTVAKLKDAAWRILIAILCARSRAATASPHPLPPKTSLRTALPRTAPHLLCYPPPRC